MLDKHSRRLNKKLKVAKAKLKAKCSRSAQKPKWENTIAKSSKRLAQS